MQRLVYSPKVYVFIRSTTQGGKIYNVSEDVVSCTVEDNVNAESHANVVLRNRFRKYIADPSNNRSIFIPNDMITVWMQRIAGYPIQKFTGYLDQAPYMLLYDDNVTLEATCTLKKLSYSWFNPGLEFFTQWVDHLPGWYIDPTTGAAQNLQQMFNLASNNKNKITDGGFAQLISEFMTHIAGWKPSMVYVSDLPSDLPKLAAHLYQRINQQDDSTLNSLEGFMRNIMGVAWRPEGGVQPNGTLASAQQRTTRAIADVVNKKNIPLIVPVVAALMATNYSPNTSISVDSPGSTDANGQPVWGYGLYAMRPSVTQVGGSHGHEKEGTTIEGYPKTKLVGQVGIATQAFVKALQANDVVVQPDGKVLRGTYLIAARAGNSGKIKAWIEAALGRTFTSDEFQTNLQLADTYVRSFTSNTPGQPTQPTPSTFRSLVHFDWQSPQVTDVMTGTDSKVFHKWYANAYATLASYFWIAKHEFKGLKLAQPYSQLDRGTIVIESEHPAIYSDQLYKYFNALSQHTGIRELTYISQRAVKSGKAAGTRESSIICYRNGQKATSTSANTDLPINTSQAVIVSIDSNAPYPAWDGQKPTTSASPSGATLPAGAGSGNPTTPITFEDLSKMSLAAAFTAQFAFPANTIEAHFLTGDKELADVTSCMDGVSQFCASSMRSFKSLPNGAFLAFYPDYFGAHGRTPYWNIRDIEILNAGVQLNDSTLATHVFTIGDTFGMGDGIDMWDYIASRGVVSMDMPMLLKSFIQPLDGDVKNVTKTGKNEPMGTLATAYDFMAHYGARPYKEEVPEIRNTFYEFLYAWQRFMQLWASTFNTSVNFTFQPEVMAGGIIGFPDHNLQMYVEQVTHTCDYENGFTTTAQLSSPAAITRTGGGIGGLPGFALAGGVNTVGTAST